MEHRNESIRAKAHKLFERDVLGARDDVLAKYRAEMASVKGDKVRGQEVYVRECVACHRLGFRDHPIGPNLVTGSLHPVRRQRSRRESPHRLRQTGDADEHYASDGRQRSKHHLKTGCRRGAKHR